MLRQLFWYVSRLPARIISFEKILGHLQGAGNSATLVHYAELLAAAFLLVPLRKFSPRPHRTKRSVPKWIIPNPALVDASVKHEGLGGFVFENLIGSHFLNILFGQTGYDLLFWREGDFEVDYVLVRDGEPIAAFEVKSGRPKRLPPASTLDRLGFSGPLRVISGANAARLLEATSVEEIMAAI